MAVQKTTFCRICEPNCPMLAEIDDSGAILELKPNPDHPIGGVPCHKGLSFLRVHQDPDRLDWPQQRLNPRTDPRGSFQEVAWNSAIADIGEKLRQLREQFGANSIAFYAGNPTAMDGRSVLYFGKFQDIIGTQMRFSASTQDLANKLLATGAVYGSRTLLAPDLYNTDYLLCIGSNPKVSHWTCISVPNDSGAVLKNIKKRGGRIRFVNPRITESSTPETGDTLQIKPDTDVYFLAALLHEININKGLDDQLISRHGKGVEGLLQFVASYPADRVSEVTGIAAEVIRTVAAEMMAAKSAVVFISTGVNQSRQGLLCSWLTEMLNFVTGNLGREGGMYMPNGFYPYASAMTIGKHKLETSAGTLELAEPMTMALPSVILPDLIESGEIKALITLCGNPLLSMSGGERLRSAFEKLELLVSIDIHQNATGEMADYILPATDWLEREDVNVFSNGHQPFPYVQYTDAMAAPAAGRKNDWWILARLSEELGGMLVDENQDPDAFGVIDRMLGASRLSMAQLRAAPQHTITLPQGDRNSLFDRCLLHEDKKIDCFPPKFVEAGLITRCETIFIELSKEPAETLKLISLRTNYMHNSTMSNVAKFRQGMHADNPVHICEADAAARGLHDGDAVRIHNNNGSIIACVRISDEMRSGVVAMSHGYGHRHVYRQRTAAAKPGVNSNQLMPTGPDSYEPLSYMSWMCGVPVLMDKVKR
ncbi:molybdopterin-dependent oxidoreductase [Pseudomonas sp. PDM31]|uniref:molybdopterin-containing oxidoreductase family protein n=1 Tax=Pseudomonas sp. PDM31 TaxID=2854778 RepID=UPI001C471621|nr:molybdopterin-dependent oxidoreductase [Pseudomonas sp. PDM31]MBV7477635.1 molybdopterin-dependent oxidoreductase [Pseudomonas sp. PDM31]